ncbi:unnamed protein product [Bursaphelenchus xylophilus]|uniref:(pine wood nematode) hypothetical protein n=1 Tax=Bursaphelenchus xylophilus TaxID=6326 RepID=A0A1I7SKY3_BURXY|nr:unnamed protein product [Bursaphelenchus xylophilus]CAG9129298.1 unnamed protein product [Bursaphelenchus xylophilus]
MAELFLGEIPKQVWSWTVLCGHFVFKFGVFKCELDFGYFIFVSKSGQLLWHMPYTENEQFWTGIAYTIPCLLTIPFHFLVLFALLRIPQLRRRAALRMMISLTVCELLQTIFLAFGGTYLILGVEMNPILNFIHSMILEASWAALLIMHPLFVLERLWFIRSNMIKVEKAPKYFFDPVLAVCWVGGILYTVGYQLGGDQFHLQLDECGWVSVGNAANSVIIHVLYYCKMAQLGIGVVATIAMFVLMVIRRRRGLDQSKIKAYELRYLIQNTVQFVMIIFNMYGYHFIPASVPYQAQVINLEWVIIVIHPAFITILVNREIRISMHNMFHKGSEISRTPIQLTATVIGLNKSTKVHTIEIKKYRKTYFY